MNNIKKCSEAMNNSKNKLNSKMVRLMCVLRAHIKLSVFGNIFSGIEKAVITFSILKKMFLKTEQ